MAVTYGKVVADGNVVALQVFVEHVVHIRKATIGMLVLSKLSDDDASDMRHQATQFDVMQHAIDFGDALTRIF